MYDLGSRIKEIRNKRGISQRELAKQINKSFSVVNGYESDAHQPPLDVAISIAQVLNVTLDYLVGNTDDTVYNFRNLSEQQQEILEMLLAEFGKSPSKSKPFSEEQMMLLHKILSYFANN